MQVKVEWNTGNLEEKGKKKNSVRKVIVTAPDPATV